MLKTLDSILDEIFQRADRLEVFADLQPKDKGKWVECRCPGCGQRTAFIYKNGIMLSCTRVGKCGYEAPMLTYINGGTKPVGDAFIKIVKELAEKLNIILPERFTSEEAAESARIAAEKLEKREAALATAHAAVNVKTIEFLEKRGFRAPGAALTADIGWIEDEQVAITLAGYEGTEDKRPWFKWLNRVVFAIRNRSGRLVGAVARSLDGEDPKYIYSRGLDMRSLGAVGLDQALADGTHTVVLVESVLEVYLARSYGIKNFAGLGGAGNAGGPERLKILYELGVRKLYALMDNDAAGRKGIDHIVDSMTDAKMPDVYVPSLAIALDGYKDIGEVAENKHSLDCVMSTLASSDHAYRYKARRMAAAYDLSNDEGRNQFIRSAYQFDNTIFDPVREDELDSYFWPEVCRLTQRDMDYVLGVRDDLKKAERYERQQKTLSDSLVKSQESFLSGDLSGAMQHLGNAYRSACESITDTPYMPILPISERLADNSRKLAAQAGKEWLGLTQVTLPELDNATMGLRKMITVASGPGIGKTIFLSQVVQDILTHHKDACSVFVSWELTGEEIIDRMKSRALRMKWSNLQLRSTEQDRDKADVLLAPIADRMVIIESANCAEKELTAEKIIREIDALKRQTGCKRCIVCVDYLQIFPVPDEIANSRSDVGRDDYIVKEMKKVRNHLDGDPLLIVSEVNKNSGSMSGKGLEKLKGSGRVPFSSDGVFFLNPLTDEELVRKVAFHNGVPMPVGKYADPPDIKKAEIPKTAAAIRHALMEEGKDYIELNISKFRDGGKKASILLTNFYELSHMESGIK